MLRYTTRTALVLCVFLSSACSHQDYGVSSPAPERHPEPDDTPSECPDPSELMVADLMRLIHSVRPWPYRPPEEDYSKEDWNRLLDVAAILQQANQQAVEIALEYYVLHYMTAFEDGVDSISEWTKPLLILRVMFDVSQEAVSEDEKYQPMSFGGFATWRPSEEKMPLSMSLPIAWGPKGPRLTGRLMGYNGQRYFAEEEYRFFRDRYPFRRGLDTFLAVQGGNKGGNRAGS